MPQFLLELFSEEIPARMQASAAGDLERLARGALSKAQLAFDTLVTFAGPRRLTLVVDGLPAAQPRTTSERKGPRIGAPAAAVEGFLRGAGVGREALIEKDGVYFVSIEAGGRPTAEDLGAMAEAMVRAFPWPKSMTWADGDLRWVRPLRRILIVFDRAVVPFSIGALTGADLTEGHRFMGERRVFRARDFEEYREALASNFVVLSADERRRRILEGARALCADRGLALVEDLGLLDEVVGMAEWPVALMGEFDPAYLALPAEVIRTTMRVHQRCFAVLAQGALAPRFVTIANIEAADGGALIAAGAARVLAARLADARFFWDEDRKTTLESRLEKLEGVVFHDKLGTLRQRADRIEAAARAIARLLGADPNAAAFAGRLAKADLATAMVGEFPELQGVMGGHYARAEGLDEPVAAAIAEHYRPQGPADRAPLAPVSAAVALADKIDTIVAFFSIGEKPTGSKDPYALRRAALGVIRILVEGRFRLPIRALTAIAGAPAAQHEELLAFFIDRLKVLLRDDGRRHDLVDAVFALGDDDLVRVVDRVSVLSDLLETEAGADLLAAYRRAGNILAAEARKGPLPQGEPTTGSAGPPEQGALSAALATIRGRLAELMAAEDFAGAARELASLRAPVDAFFDKVLVNSSVPAERDERLRLLAQVRATMAGIADFARISG
jgi:glycyl-tRNA synthetase beta chain